MQTTDIIPSNTFDLEKTAAKAPLSEVFPTEDKDYLNEFKLYIAHFHNIPNLIELCGINLEKASSWLVENYASEIKENYYKKMCLSIKRQPFFSEIFYFLYDDLLIYFDIRNIFSSISVVKFLFKKTPLSKVEEIISHFNKFKEKEKRTPKLSLLINTSKGINTKSMEITKPRLNIEDNYNNDFKEIHKTILKRLSKKNDKGLVLLHGKPGTGKTSYIRFLTASLKKKVIFLPPNMASAITNPDLISVLIDNPNSIFVIEDAENIVIDREHNGASPVSALLNISDGLLADCLNVQIICSFNTDLSKVDSALLRKGRMIAKYEFKELEVEKARRLSEKLGFKTNIDEPMTLAAIYNQEEMNFDQPQRKMTVGFR